MDSSVHQHYQLETRWDESPTEEPHQQTILPLHGLLHHHQNSQRFKAISTVAYACVRLHRLSKIRAMLLKPSPVSRLKACAYVVIAIVRLQITLPALKKRRTELLQLLRAATSHLLKTDKLLFTKRRRSSEAVTRFVFRSRAWAIHLCSVLVRKLHQRHHTCAPLETAQAIISETFKVKLDRALNPGKCKVLLMLFSSIDRYCITFRIILNDMQQREAGCSSSFDPQKSKNKAVSCCYYSIKDLCRWLLLCKQYVMDCTGYLPSRKVFAKLESANTIQCLILDLNRCFQQLQCQVEDLIRNVYAEVTLLKEFGWERSPPCLPGLSMGLLLHLEAKKDLSGVLEQLNKQHLTKNNHNWTTFMINWMNRLSIAEEAALAKLLLDRLSYDGGIHQAIGSEDPARQRMCFLKSGLFVNPKHVKVVRFLGAGSYGKVEEVLCFGERYAMKTIKGLGSVEDANEAVIQARLHHPNILKLIWYTKDYETENSLSLLTELKGCDLQAFVAHQARGPRGPLLNYPLMAVDIMEQIAKGMRYLHGEGVMHRDLKCANVLVDFGWSPDAFKEGYVHVKVGDFGLAKVKEAGKQALQFHTRDVGTKFWRAPEVFGQQASTTPTTAMRGSSRHCVEAQATDGGLAKYSFSADVYSFAMTCYEILTGKKPFADVANKTGLKERIVKLHERPVLPAEQVHPGLRHLVERCWDGDPEKRPTFAVICEQLDAIKQDLTFGI